MRVLFSSGHLNKEFESVAHPGVGKKERKGRAPASQGARMAHYQTACLHREVPAPRRRSHPPVPLPSNPPSPHNIAVRGACCMQGKVCGATAEGARTERTDRPVLRCVPQAPPQTDQAPNCIRGAQKGVRGGQGWHTRTHKYDPPTGALFVKSRDPDGPDARETLFPAIIALSHEFTICECTTAN